MNNIFKERVREQLYESEVVPIATHVKSHILEKVIGTLMAVFGIVALYIFFTALRQDLISTDLAIIQILLIVVLAILAQTIVLIRIYEQNQELLGKRWTVFGLLITLASVAGAVWVIVDILNNQKKMDQTEKIIWIVAAVLVGIITAPVYYFVKKRWTRRR